MTTTEEATHLFHKAGEIAGWKPGVGNPLVINYLRIFADLVKAGENEACAKDAHEFWIRNTDTSPAEAIRARRNHG